RGPGFPGRWADGAAGRPPPRRSAGPGPPGSRSPGGPAYLRAYPLLRVIVEKNPLVSMSGECRPIVNRPNGSNLASYTPEVPGLGRLCSFSAACVNGQE